MREGREKGEGEGGREGNGMDGPAPRNKNKSRRLCLTLRLQNLIANNTAKDSERKNKCASGLLFPFSLISTTHTSSNGRFRKYKSGLQKNERKKTPRETQKLRSAYNMQAGSVLHLCTKVEADSSFGSKVIPKISKSGHVTQATPI